MAENLQAAFYQIGELQRMVKHQADEIKHQSDEIAAIERRNVERDKERAALERKQLLWGITFLGGIIVTLGTVIWSYRGVIFKGQS